MIIEETKGKWVRISNKVTTPSGEELVLSWWQKSDSPVAMKNFQMEQTKPTPAAAPVCEWKQEHKLPGSGWLDCEGNRHWLKSECPCCNRSIKFKSEAAR
jgi:hypothetical protein